MEWKSWIGGSLRFKKLIFRYAEFIGKIIRFITLNIYHQKKVPIMFNYEIGGNERRIDTSEAFVDISPNKTLFVQQLTEQEPIKPEIVEGLKTVEEVFKHFKPKVSVDFE